MDAAHRPTEDALRGFLRERLPDHMVPAQVVVLDAIPLLPNGKVDRRSLPAPSRVADLEGGIAPRTPLECTVAAVWEQVLETTGVGALDNFFALGGNSLLLLSVRARLSERLGRAVDPTELLRNPSVEAQARYLEAGVAAPAPAAAPAVPDTRAPAARAGLARARMQARGTATLRGGGGE